MCHDDEIDHAEIDAQRAQLDEMNRAELAAEERRRLDIYNAGYDAPTGTRNPWPVGSVEALEWSEGYDEGERVHAELSESHYADDDE